MGGEEGNEKHFDFDARNISIIESILISLRNLRKVITDHTWAQAAG